MTIHVGTATLTRFWADITVISPVFDDDAKTICFYTASRGHHLNIGGYRGNSMPP